MCRGYPAQYPPVPRPANSGATDGDTVVDGSAVVGPDDQQVLPVRIEVVQAGAVAEVEWCVDAGRLLVVGEAGGHFAAVAGAGDLDGGGAGGPEPVQVDAAGQVEVPVGEDLAEEGGA